MSNEKEHEKQYWATLCWDCKKAGGGYGCPWIDEKPSGTITVPGWKTKPKILIISNHRGYKKGHIVRKCPLYEEDKN